MRGTWRRRGSRQRGRAGSVGVRTARAAGLADALRRMLGSTAKDLSHVPCRFFQKGRCEMGDNCHFSHDRGERESRQRVS